MARQTFRCSASGSFMPCSRPDHRSMRVLIPKYTRSDSVSQAGAHRHQVEVWPCSRKRVWSQHLPFLGLGRVLLPSFLRLTIATQESKQTVCPKSGQESLNGRNYLYKTDNRELSMGLIR